LLISLYIGSKSREYTSFSPGAWHYYFCNPRV